VHDDGVTATATDRPELALIEQHLRRARARVEAASPGGPEFDAAMAALEELEARLLAALSGSYEDAPARGARGLART
jgi:hypothetical protein